MEQRLYRSRSDAILGGLYGGLRDYFDIDANIIRLVFGLLAEMISVCTGRRLTENSSLALVRREI